MNPPLLVSLHVNSQCFRYVQARNCVHEYDHTYLCDEVFIIMQKI